MAVIIDGTTGLTTSGSSSSGGGGVSTSTALGGGALFTNSSGANTTAIGYQAGYSTTAGSNVFVGSQAGYSNTTATNNVAIGYQALYSNTTGAQNTAVGREAGKNITTASYNCFVGDGAGTSTTSARNTFIGQGAGNAVTSGANNTIIGGYNGNNGGIDIRTSSNNIVLADGEGNVKQWWSSTGYWEYTNNTQLRLPSTGGTGYIGYLADSSSIQISYNSQANGVRLTSGATSWSTWSDQRLKNVTGTYTTPLADISQLQPIKFTWKSDEENKPQVGILAQSVQLVVPEAVEEGTISLEDETKYLTVRYTELIPLMVASIKELKTIVDAQAARIATLEAK